MENMFGKQEKLKSRKLIEKLFKEGSSVKKFPLRLVFLQTSHTSNFPIQASFSVPKRNFKKAVDRNRIKRQIREAYRLNKESWLEATDRKPAYVAIMYVAKEHNNSIFIQKKLKKVFSLLSEQYLRNK